MAYNYGNFFAGVGDQRVGGLGVIPQDRLQTSASGGSYIGGMAPQLPTQDMSFMWGGNASAPPPAAPGTGWDQSSVGAGGLGYVDPGPVQPDDNHPNGVYPGPYNPNYGQPTGGGGGGSSVNLQSYQQNPYLAQMGEGLRNQFTGFMNDGLAGNRGAAVASGGVGGSRQGISEARTMTDAGKGFDSALANLYGNDYQQQMGRNLQQYGMDQNYRLGQRGLDLGFQNSDNSYNLGLGGLDLQSRGQDMNFNTQQRGLDQSGAALGANLYNLGMQGPWNTLNNANGLASPYTGNNGTTTSNTSSGGGLGGILGGMGAGYQWWNGLNK